MDKQRWYKIKVGDVLTRKSGSEAKVIKVRETKGGSKCIEVESGGVYCTSERKLFV
jgi:hypothetical protein